MGICSSKVTLPDQTQIEIKLNLEKSQFKEAAKKLVNLNKEYDHHDRSSQQKIDEFTLNLLEKTANTNQ